MTAQGSLELIERCYDAIPRVAATTEEVGPFTLFRAAPGTGWDFYARPRLGLADELTAEDVRRVLARQREAGVARAIEWVHEVTPSLLPAARSAVPEASLEECPLLALEGPPAGADPPVRVAVLAADSPDLPLAVGAVAAAFGGTDEVTPGDVGRRGELVASGELVVAAAYDGSGALIGAGSAAPRGEAAELMGIGVLPRGRRQGIGAALTRALVREVRSRGVTTAYLSAGSDDAASVYRAVGFARLGTAYILEVPDSVADG